MSKPKTSIGDWLSRTFGSSYKTISEKLSAEEHDAFVKDAEKLQSDDDDDDSDGDSDDDDDDDDETTADPKNADPKSKGATTVEARLTALEASLATKKAELKSAEKTNKTLTSKVTELEGQLKASEDQKKKLRNSVNQLGDEDLTNSVSEEEFLTQADIDARASYDRSNPKK